MSFVFKTLIHKTLSITCKYIVFDNLLELAIQSNQKDQSDIVRKSYKIIKKLLNIYEKLNFEHQKMQYNI